LDTDLPVDERLIIDEMNSCVREVIDSLPEDYRAAIVLHDLEGQSAKETAEVVGCSVATAKIRIRAKGAVSRTAPSWVVSAISSIGTHHQVAISRTRSVELDKRRVGADTRQFRKFGAHAVGAGIPGNR